MVEQQLPSLSRVAAGLRRRTSLWSTAIFQTALFWLRHHDRNLLEKFDRGFSENVDLDPVDEEAEQVIIERVKTAYRLAKAAQLNAPSQFAVGPMWDGVVQRNFGDVAAAMDDEGSSHRLAEVLARFHRNPCSLWAGGSYEDLLWARRNPLYRFQFINTWLRYRQAYWDSAGEAVGLSYSQIGQPVGMDDGSGVIPLESIRYHHWARRMTELTKQSEHPVICEIGGGLGGQAFKVASNPDWAGTYLIFDIPETLLIASYFLLHSLPERKIMLFGEGSLNPLDKRGCDLALLPNFEISTLPDAGVDLVFNSCSFSEMLKETALAYLCEVERICAGFILHINHTAEFEWEVDGKRRINLPANQFQPEPLRFKLIDLQDRPFGRVEDRAFLRRHRARHQVFLYERTGGARMEIAGVT